MTVSLPLKRAFALALVVAGGVLLRAYGRGFGLAAFWIKYGGSALWAAMIFFLIALMLRARPREHALYVAALVCACGVGVPVAVTTGRTSPPAWPNNTPAMSNEICILKNVLS